MISEKLFYMAIIPQKRRANSIYPIEWNRTQEETKKDAVTSSVLWKFEIVYLCSMVIIG